KRIAANLGLALLKVKRPWRAAWTSRGLYPDGWLRPGRPASLRIFAQDDDATQNVKVAVTLDSPPEATGEVSYAVGTARGTLAPTIRAVPETTVCVPAGGYADVTVRSQRAARINGPPFEPKREPPRSVGLIVSGVTVSPTGNPCTR